VILTGFDVPKKPVIMRVCGLSHFSPIAFATFLQLFELKNAFFARWNNIEWLTSK